MTIEVQDLTDLDSSKVEQIREFLISLVQEENPELDLRGGVVHDIDIHIAALLEAARQENTDRLRRSSSLLAIEEDPTLAEDDVVDKVLSNFRLARRAGSQAEGSITIVVSKLVSVTVPNGAVFTADGKEFRATAAYVARTTAANIQSDSDRVLLPVGDGNYSFTIDVIAAEEGASGMVTKDTLFIPSITITNFVRSFATSDFTGGVDTETNAALLARLQEGLAAQALSNRVNMNAMLRAQSGFENILQTSIIGFGDAEMLRDRHSVFPVSYGGRVDWYVRSQELPRRLGLIKTATLIEKTSDRRGTWQFSIDRDDAPGFYDIERIAPADATTFVGSFSKVQEVRGNDLAPVLGELLPDIVTVAEGAYSRYQTAVVQFTDDETDTSDLATGDEQDYQVTLRTMPLIAAMQTVVGSRSHRNYAGDVLVKAPVPCFVSLSFTLNGRAGDRLPDPFLIKEALASYVNNLGFPGRLEASALLDIIHNYLSGRTTVSAIDMFAQILRPSGTVKPLRSTEVLLVPDESANMVTARTVGFILEPENIAISAQTVNTPEEI